MNDAKERQCVSCGTFLVKPVFRMTKAKLQAVHALARQKGLDDELYRLRLQAVGVDSSKKLRRKQFDEFMTGLKALPDAPK